jgi:hypothetical protein
MVAHHEELARWDDDLIESTRAAYPRIRRRVQW